MNKSSNLCYTLSLSMFVFSREIKASINVKLDLNWKHHTGVVLWDNTPGLCCVVVFFFFVGFGVFFCAYPLLLSTHSPKLGQLEIFWLKKLKYSYLQYVSVLMSWAHE